MNNWEKYSLRVNDWDNLLKIKFRENCLPNGIFCDIGACEGIFTKFFMDMAKEGFVYAFELSPHNYDSIKHLSRNNCLIENMAICNACGKVQYYSNRNSSADAGCNIVGVDTAYRAIPFAGEVESTTLDSYFYKNKPNYIKIDVEGAELEVLKGGIETISNADFIVIECHFQKMWKDIYDFLCENGLKFRNIVDDVDVFYDETGKTPVVAGMHSNGMPYQMYMKKE